MNAATFRAIRETCGIPQSAVAEALDVRIRTVKYWESGETPVPLDAIEWIEAELENHDDLVAQAVDSVEEAFKGIGVEPGSEPPVRLTYWRTQGEFERHGRDSKGEAKEASMVNANARAVAQVLRDLQYEVEFAYWDEGAIQTPGSRY